MLKEDFFNICLLIITMYFPSSFFAISLLICISSLYALNTTTTTKAAIIACHQDSQCSSSTQFCNTKQNVCMAKYSVNASCQSDDECLNGKCHDHLCRRACKEDKDCSHTKEYCSTSKYCKDRHCGLCRRNAHCANDHCIFIVCATKTCESALKTLKTHP